RPRSGRSTLAQTAGGQTRRFEVEEIANRFVHVKTVSNVRSLRWSRARVGWNATSGRVAKWCGRQLPDAKVYHRPRSGRSTLAQPAGSQTRRFEVEDIVKQILAAATSGMIRFPAWHRLIAVGSLLLVLGNLI